MPFKKLWINLVVTTSALFSFQAMAFDVYGFIPYTSRIENGELIRGRPDQSWFSGLGIKPIEVIYDNKILSFPKIKNSKKNAKIDSVKIKSVAGFYRQNNSHLVSLDMESWDRFDDKTPQKILDTIEEYRRSHPEAVVGLYSTVPQNTYGWSPKKRKHYDSLNAKYNEVAKAVDYFSPSLYNYSSHDFSSWLEGARYNIAAAKKYSAEKKVLPYITPEVGEGRATRWLTYDEMMMRLQALQSLGADGCIVWASSRARDTSGAAPVLNPQEGWLKAVSDFAQGGRKP